MREYVARFEQVPAECGELQYVFECNGAPVEAAPAMLENPNVDPPVWSACITIPHEDCSLRVKSVCAGGEESEWSNTIVVVPEAGLAIGILIGALFLLALARRS